MKLKREVIVPYGPSRLDVVREYRELRLTIERAEKFRARLWHRAELSGQRRNVDPMDVLDELDRLIKTLKEFL